MSNKKEHNKDWGKAFTQGYCCAVANIMRTHDEETIAIDVLVAGASEKDAKESGVDERDMEVLRPLWKEIRRKGGK